jgi:TPP-dependent pyruvate/acetoin dehydrogenase alpha subunit
MPAQVKADGQGEAQPAGNGAATLDAAMLKRLYACMLKCRMVEERARLLFQQGKLAGNFCAAAGQEATEVGATIDLLPEDTIAPSRRNLGTHVVKGTPLKDMFARLYVRKPSPERDDSSPAVNVIPPASSMRAQFNIATGVALACKLQKKPCVTVTLSGDDSTSPAVWQEAVNFAGAHGLPIVYVIGRQTAAEELSVKAQAYGVPGITVAGNDVVAVYRVAREAIKRARDGHGPTVIECETAAIDPARYGSPQEVEYGDPIAIMERYLQKQQLWSGAWKRQLTGEFNQEIDAAIRFAENSR